ncbi:MAG: Txe/YoeB family addiction module toxin [Sulfuricella sp.]
MIIKWSDEAWDNYLYWPQTDKVALKRINALIKDIQRSPFEGIGKPEALRYNLSGFWSRRINDEHRLVYTIENGCIEIVNCRYHY